MALGSAVITQNGDGRRWTACHPPSGSEGKGHQALSVDWWFQPSAV